MRKLLLLLPALAAALAVTAAPAPGATIPVAIKAGGFSPSVKAITAGDTVTWLNADTTNHQVVADDASFASPILRPGASFSYKFDRVATVRYHDGLDKGTAAGST